jgi:hypothetical protein
MRASFYLLALALFAAGCNTSDRDNATGDRAPGSVAGTGITSGDSSPSTHSQT